MNKQEIIKQFISEARLIEDDVDNINIHSVYVNKQHGTRTIYVFKKPVIYRDLRIVPMHPNIAISSDGSRILNIRTGKYLSTSISTTGYLRVSYSIDGLKFRDKVHRMVAYAWVNNSDWEKRYSVNHIDGNKLNNDFRNLEWVTYKENSAHSASVLKNKCLRCRMFDILEQKEYFFDSLVECARYLDVDKRLLSLAVRKMRTMPLFRRRYELRYEDDELPWRFTGVKIIMRPEELLGKYYYLVKHNGEKLAFFTGTTLKSYFCGIFGGMYITKVLDIVNILKENGIDIEVVEFKPVSTIYIMDTHTNEVVSVRNINRASEYCGCTYHEIHNALNSEGYMVSGRYRISETKVFNSNLDMTNNRSKFLVTRDKYTGEVRHYKSLADFIVANNCTRNQVRCFNDVGRVFDNLVVQRHG